MKFEVVQTHLRGKRLSKAEIAEAVPYVGTLNLYDWHAGNASNRNLRVAELTESYGTVTRCVLSKLFDAIVVKVTLNGLHVIGFETEIDEGGPVHYIQGWWAKPVGE